MIPGYLTLRSADQLSESAVPTGTVGGRPLKPSITLCVFPTLSVTPLITLTARSPRHSSHLCPAAARWRWSISPGSTSSELSERTVASATSQNPSLCRVQARRRWRRPAGCRRPPYRPPAESGRRGRRGGGNRRGFRPIFNLNKPDRDA